MLFASGVECVAAVILPGDDADKIGHERGNAALEHRRVASDHVLIVYLALVKLLHH